MFGLMILKRSRHKPASLMSVTKLSTKDFNIEKCSRCKRKFTRAMMMQYMSQNYRCIRCYNGGSFDPYLIKTKKILKRSK